jgi:murein L,D-transpeptidase YcbB/YkuD
MSRSLAGWLAASLVAVGSASAQPLSEADFADAPSWLGEAYAARGFEPVWSRGGQPSAAFEALVSAVEGLDARGIDPEAYGLSGLRRLSTEPVAVREQGASLVFAKLASDLLEGRTDPEIEYQPNFGPEVEARRGRILNEAFSRRMPTDYLDAATPDNFLVERLQGALVRYRRIASQGGWRAVPSDVVIEPGEEHDAIPAIRDRLVREGFHAGSSRRPDDRMTAPVANDEFTEALKAFQRSRSISDDGVVGPNTLAALNETPEELIQRLEVNIERARWLPSDLGDEAALVNIADFTLRLYEGEREVDDIPVVVGEEEHQTPVFADTMETVVVNPYWNVPSSILINEIAPQQVADPSYVDRKRFEVLRGGEVVPAPSVDWRAAAAGRPSFRVRQMPGEDNALGLIKFLFPNKYAVYLHDTPAEQLFARDVRTFSHGCIRVKEPLRFGAWILRRSEAEIAGMIRSGERQEIETPPVPVYITYMTAWAEADGTVRFARDVYGRDDALAARLGVEGS